MDVREKLVYLVKNALRAYGKDLGKIVEPYEFIADFLIHSGVTVQEWISVAEPPKEYRDKYGELIPFLVCVEGTEYPFRAMYDGKTWGDGIFAITVKWWMHLPAPPKEMDETVEEGKQ